MIKLYYYTGLFMGALVTLLIISFVRYIRKIREEKNKPLNEDRQVL